MRRPRHLLTLAGLAGVLLAVAAIAPYVHADDAPPAARVASMYADYKERSFAEIPDLTVDEARAFADRASSSGHDPVWLDVRAARERRVSRLPGAIDREAFEEQRDDLEGRPVIVYCTIGYRSGMAARDLRRQGFEAYNLAGGILAWAHAGGEVVDGRTGDPSRRVHVYGWRWDLLPEGWKAVW